VTEGTLLPDTDETREIAKKVKEMTKKSKGSGKKGKKGKDEGGGGNAAAEGKRKAEGTAGDTPTVIDEEAILKAKRARYLANNSLTTSYDPLVGDEMAEGGGKRDPRGVLRPILPFPLKKILVDDWSSCTASRSRMVVDLPAKITVEEIFNRFLVSKGVISGDGNNGSSGGDGKRSALKDAEWTHFCEAMTLTFETALPVMLLYKEVSVRCECGR